MSYLTRWLFVVLALGGAGYAGRHAYDTWAAAAGTKIDSITFHEPAKAAVENKLATSRALSQAALVLIGVLWGLIIAKPGEVQIVFGDWPEVIMFSLANAVVLAALVAGHLYAEQVSRACTSAIEIKADPPAAPRAGDEPAPRYAIPNVFGPRINFLFELQTGFVLVAVCAAGLTFLSAHRLK